MSNRTLPAASGILSPVAKPLYRYIHIGDSVTQGSSDAQTNAFGSTDLVWQVVTASQGALLPVRNAGVGGQTASMIAARVTRDVLKYAPDVVGVTMGTNDVIIHNHANYILPSLQAIHATLKSAGVFFFFTTIPPYASRAALVNSINQVITGFCAANGVPCVDLYAIGADPANAGAWRANYSHDGTHPTRRTSWRFGQEIWRVLSPLLTSGRKHQRPRVHDAANLLFPPTGIANTGAPAASNVRDGLFTNSRTLAMNGYSVPAPYLWDAVATSSGTAPTVTGAMEQMAGVSGNVWRLTASPNGTGSVNFSINHNSTTPAGLDLTRYQGRRLRWSFLLGTEGFDVDNTDAWLAANNNGVLSRCGLALALRDRAGNYLPSLYIADPVDGSGTLGQASNISLDWGVYVLSNGGQSFDIPLTPYSVEFNVPPGAWSPAINVGIFFATGAASPVTMRLAEMMFVDVGPAQYPALTVSNDPLRFMDVTAAVTLTRAQVLGLDYFRCNATSGAQTVTLPAANVMNGIPLTFKKTDASGNAVTVAAAGSDTIDGAATKALAAQYNYIRIVSNGLTGWDVIAAG